MLKSTRLDELYSDKEAIEERIDDLEREIAQEEAIEVTWKDIKWIITDQCNWSAYSDEIDDSNEGYNLCGRGRQCESSVCAVHPNLKQFETLDNDFGDRIFKCVECFDIENFKLEDYIDPDEYSDTDTFRLDQRQLTIDTLIRLTGNKKQKK